MISDEAIRQGLESVKWLGRLEVLSRDPLLVVDGAHNGDSAQRLAAALHEVFHLDQWTLIIGISADKDIPAILDGLLPIAERVIVTRASNSRAANVETIGAQIADRGYELARTTSVAEALEAALHDQSPIIVTGSLFTVADAREAWFKRIGLPLEKDE
jgi:dihydrofolate synthase/folylpolyglutamate synthase